MAYEVSQRAFDFARSQGLDRAAVMGLGPEIRDRMVAARTATLRPQLAQARFNAAYGTMARIGEGTASGQYGATRAAVEASAFGEFAGYIADSERESANYANSAQNAWIGVLSDLDARTQQERQFQRQLDESKPGPLDIVLGLAPIFF